MSDEKSTSSFSSLVSRSVAKLSGKSARSKKSVTKSDTGISIILNECVDLLPAWASIVVFEQGGLELTSDLGVYPLLPYKDALFSAFLILLVSCCKND